MWWTLGLALLGGFFLIGCAKEETPTDGGGTTPPQERTIRNLWVDTAKGYALLDFERGDTVSLALRGTAEWDLLLPALSPRTRSVDILLNSGTVNPSGKTRGVVLDQPYGQVKQIPADVQLREDDTAAARRVISPSVRGEGLFLYNSQTRTLIPLPKTLVLQTRSGKYVKVQFVSLYKDAPAQPDPFQLGYWTIRYTVSPTRSFP
ncbi:MAG: HmuY family protein [Candidatus Kapabacteria bacterium]|nr:HmuY family protein [Candidatus Kapabacteria bacterium]MDW8011933.1 HmuY family protein [Bacteroidota bacterium]